MLVCIENRKQAPSRLFMQRHPSKMAEKSKYVRCPASRRAPRRENAPTGTMNAVHSAPGCRFWPPHLYARRNRGPHSYIFRFFSPPRAVLIPVQALLGARIPPHPEHQRTRHVVITCDNIRRTATYREAKTQLIAIKLTLGASIKSPSIAPLQTNIAKRNGGPP